MMVGDDCGQRFEEEEEAGHWPVVPTFVWFRLPVRSAAYVFIYDGSSNTDLGMVRVCWWNEKLRCIMPIAMVMRAR